MQEGTAFVVTIAPDGSIELPEGAMELGGMRPGVRVAWVKGADPDLITLATIEEIQREVTEIAQQMARVL